MVSTSAYREASYLTNVIAGALVKIDLWRMVGESGTWTEGRVAGSLAGRRRSSKINGVLSGHHNRRARSSCPSGPRTTVYRPQERGKPSTFLST